MTNESIAIVEISHSKFSPSGSGRWLHCPGSIQLEEKLQIEQTSSIYAMEGTAAHELASKCLIESSDAKKYMGYEIGQFTVDHEMANAVQVYLDHVRQYRTFESRFLVEQRVDLSFIHEGMKGTADAVVENPTSVEVIDYKHGKGVAVEAHDGKEGPNSQLGIYAIGVLYEIFQRRGSLDHIEEVNLHIVQPRCPHPEGPIRTFRTTVEELKDLSRRVRESIADACSPDPTFEPGEKQCQWCPAAAVCKHLAGYNLQMAQLEFADLQTPDPEPTNPNSFTRQELSTILKHMGLFDSWLKAVAKYAMDELRLKRPIPEFKLVRGRANRIWKDEKMAKDLLVNMGYEDDDLYKKKFVSPAQAEQLVGRKNKEDLGSYITKPLGKITIAHESDRRPAADPNDDAVNEFAAFQND